MKIINKIVIMFALVFALVFALITIEPMDVQAASGRIMFTDLTVEAGDEFKITVKVVTYDDPIGTISVNLKYDNSKIQFLNGDSSTGSDGKITITADATGTENSYDLNFRALKNCETAITITDQTIKTSSDKTFTIKEGSSVVSIEGGTEVEESTTGNSTTQGTEIDDSAIQIDGVFYEISEEYLESEIPSGFSKAQMEIRGTLLNVIVGDGSDIVLVYLEAPNEPIEESEYGYTPKGRFFLYNEDTGKFSPYVQITVSDSTYIVFLTEAYEVELPIQYIPTTMTADGFEFPAWQDAEIQGYYLVYAVSSKGVKGLYRYDVDDQSYQRFEMPADPENPNQVSNENLQILVDTIAENLLIVLLIIGLLIFLLLILTLTFGIKLRNRNREIDDIYEEGVNAYSGGIPNGMNNETSSRNAYVDDYDVEEEEYDDFDEEYDEEYEIPSPQNKKAPAESQNLDMLDDGLTHEFDINLNDTMFSNDGFVNYQNDRYAGMADGVMPTYNFQQANASKGNDMAGFDKYQADDDDDIEFIEI